VISNGVIALEADNANSDGVGNSAFGSTNNVITLSGGTLQLFGFNGSQGTQHNRFFNPLVVPAGQTGSLRMFQRGRPDSGANSGCASTLTGSGTLNLVVAYVRGQLDGNWSAFSGLINVTAKAGADEMRINNDFGLAAASVFLNDGVLLDRLQSNTTNDIGELGGTALARIANGNGTGANTTWRVGMKNTSATFAGTIENDNAIIKVGTGTWTLTAANPFSGSAIVSDGILALGDGVTDGSIDGSTNINIVTPGILNVAARSDGTLQLGQVAPQTLRGNGILRGALTVGGQGTVSPGLPVGILTVTNAATLGGTAVANLNRNASPNVGRLVAPSIALGGTLIVENVGANLQVGDTFDLYDGVLTGDFTSVVLPPYYTWNTNNLPLDGTISVVAVNAPKIKVSVGGGNVSLNATNGIPGGNVLVSTSTNLSIPLSTWTHIDTNVFDLDGAYNLVIPVDPAAPRQFYLLQAY
jgi:autotransporter-associated beta strand protein